MGARYFLKKYTNFYKHLVLARVAAAARAAALATHHGGRIAVLARAVAVLAVAVLARESHIVILRYVIFCTRCGFFTKASTRRLFNPVVE